MSTCKNHDPPSSTFGTGYAAVSEITTSMENPIVTINFRKHVRHTGTVFPFKELGILARKCILALRKGPLKVKVDPLTLVALVTMYSFISREHR